MNNIILTTLFFISYVAYAADNQRTEVIADLNEITIDEESSEPLLPGALDLSQQLTAICYGKDGKTDNNKFCVAPFEQHLKTLQKNNPEEYRHIATCIQTQSQKRNQGASQRSMLPKNNNIRMELLKFALEALEEKDKQQDDTIQTLQTSGTWKKRGLIGSVALILLETGVYFLYAYLSSHSC